MADDTRKFYDNLRANLRGIHHQDSRPQGSNERTRPYYVEQHNPTLKKTPSGAFKAVSKSTNANHKPGFVSVGANDLNVMDYVNYMGWSFTRTNEPGIQYRIGATDPRQEVSHNGKNDLNSISLGLNPQPFYLDRKDKDGNVHRVEARDENGKKIQVTGKGAFSRFSESDYGQGQGGDDLVRIIQDTQDIDNQKDAYQFIENMRKEYGSKTRFDPLDPDMKLPQSAEGRTVNYEDGSQKTRSTRGEFLNGSPKDDFSTTNPYYDTASMGYDNLQNPEIGGKALEELHERGYDDKTIQRRRIGWLPGKDDPNHDQITRYFNDKGNQDYGMGIHTRLSQLGKDGKAHDRFGGMFIYPKVKHGQVVGINGFDKDHGINDTPVQAVSNEKLTHYERHYSTSPYGLHKNGLKKGQGAFDDWTYRHGNHTESGVDFATGYLSRKRNISGKLVKHMMDRDLLRVSLGQKGDFDSLKELNQRQQSYDHLKDHRSEYLKDGHKGTDYVKELARRQKLAHDKQLQDKAHGKEAYIEFPHKLSDNETRDLHADRQRTVGADRIYFKPGTKDFKPTGKGVAPGSMPNYGFNMTLGNDTSNKRRHLYVFKSPSDAMSYMDLHRKQIRGQITQSNVPIDILSLGGTAGRTKTLSNFIHHKIDDSDGQHYNRIVFGTDNSEGGQSLIAHYTEHARHQMPRDSASDFFQVAKPPYAKDWNDTSRLLGNTPEDQAPQVRRKLNARKSSYSLDEYMDGVAREHYAKMTKKGRKLEKDLNDKSKVLYTAYENKGEKERTTQDAKALRAYDKSEKALSHSPTSYQAHQDFENDGKGIGGTMTPFEKDRTLRAMVNEDNQADMTRAQDNYMNNDFRHESNIAHQDQDHRASNLMDEDKGPNINDDTTMASHDASQSSDGQKSPAPKKHHRMTKSSFRKKMNEQNRINAKKRAAERKRHQSSTAAADNVPKNHRYQSPRQSQGIRKGRGVDNRNKHNNNLHW